MKKILTYDFSLWIVSRYILFIFIRSFGNIPNQLSSHDLKWFILMKYPVNLTWKEFSFEDTRPTEFRNNLKWLLKGLSFIINPVCSRLPGVAKSLSVALSIWALVCTTECPLLRTKLIIGPLVYIVLQLLWAGERYRPPHKVQQDRIHL